MSYSECCDCHEHNAVIYSDQPDPDPRPVSGYEARSLENIASGALVVLVFTASVLALVSVGALVAIAMGFETIDIAAFAVLGVSASAAFAIPTVGLLQVKRRLAEAAEKEWR